MINIFTPKEIRKIDSDSINQYGISGIQLMENAASNSANFIKSKLKNGSKIAIFCGIGNNGGDGFAIARHLLGNFELDVYWIGSETKMSKETLANYRSNQRLGINQIKLESDSDLTQIYDNYDCIIDSLIGIGGSENLNGLVVDILSFIRDYNSLKIAIDVPSGLNSITGKAHKNTLVADFTLTMFAPKIGFYFLDGITHCGEIVNVSIGSPKNLFDDFSNHKLLEKLDLKRLIEKRKIDSSKFDFGRLSIFAGSKNMAGAGVLVANSAINSGCGLVHLTGFGVRDSLLPEVMLEDCELNSKGFISDINEDRLNKLFAKSDAIAIGPGLGKDMETMNLVKSLLIKNESNKFVIDADALSVLDSNSRLNKNIVITPHTGEMAQITGLTRDYIENNRVDIAKEWANKLDCIVLLKGKTSVISDGEICYFNIIGNSGMATAGSGDVLTGIIASFLAQGYSTLNATLIGSLIHSIAGDNLSKKINLHSITASKLIDEIRNINL